MVDKGQVTEDIIAQNPQYRDTAAYAHNTAAVNPPNDTSEGSTAHEGEEAPSLVITGTSINNICVLHVTQNTLYLNFLTFLPLSYKMSQNSFPIF